MNDIVKLLDVNLNYLEHTIAEAIIYIFIESILESDVCTFCGTLSSKIHNNYQRSFQDLPIQGKKVEIIINNRKIFCHNEDCEYTTFAQRFSFINYKSKKTKSLENEIIQLSLNCSSIIATKHLNKNAVKIGKSTVCHL